MKMNNNNDPLINSSDDFTEERILSSDAIEKQFILYVNSKLEEMEGYLQIRASKEVSLYELEEAFKGYQHILFMLIGLENIAYIRNELEKEKFNTWFAEKFLIVRTETNKPELSGQKWASAKELEYIVRFNYKSEYSKYKQSLLLCECEYKTIHDILDAWKSYSYNLNSLQSNLKTDIGTSGFENKR
jgi:hypothetical protein